MQLLKYFGTSKKFLRTSGFLLATCPGQVAEKKIWSPLFIILFYELWVKGYISDLVDTLMYTNYHNN